MIVQKIKWSLIPSLHGRTGKTKRSQVSPREDTGPARDKGRDPLEAVAMVRGDRAATVSTRHRSLKKE